VRFVLLPGHRYDSIGVPPLIEDVDFGGLIADKAFDSNALVAELNERRAKVVISQHPARSQPLKIDLELYKWRHLIEIVFTQMTKAPALTVGTERDDIADLHLVFGDHDAVNQQFQELAALGEVGLGQPTLHPLAELGR
jgi:hypothetical protein